MYRKVCATAAKDLSTHQGFQDSNSHLLTVKDRDSIFPLRLWLLYQLEPPVLQREHNPWLESDCELNTEPDRPRGAGSKF